MKRGRVIDPGTDRGGKFNVGLKGDQIATRSDQPLKSKAVVDVPGMMVPPGLIARHAHGRSIPSNRVPAYDSSTTALEPDFGK